MFEQRLNELAARHLTRRLTPLYSGVGPVVEMAGRQILLLASNDYLGLAMHPEVIQSAIEATQRFGQTSVLLNTFRCCYIYFTHCLD